MLPGCSGRGRARALVPRGGCLLAALAATAATGCVTLDLLRTRGSRAEAARHAFLEGEVSSVVASDAPLVVVAVRIDCEAWRPLRDAVARLGPLAPGEPPPELRALGAELRGRVELEGYFVRETPGRWYLSLAPGCYGLAAFEDSNRNGRYDDEPALRALDASRLFELEAGARREGLHLAIPPDGRLAIDSADPAALEVRQLAARSGEEQLFVSLDAVAVEGVLGDLADPRFGAESGRLGYFDPIAFSWRIGPGIYFLEEYDPEKIPVLFVHGALGHPSEFEPLVKGLDRTRYQPWVFFYPSGGRLGAAAEFLSQLVTRLRLRLGFERLAVVAHSMGGLVARSFILKHHEAAREDPVELFVALSTPWGGVESARRGSLFPESIRVPSWEDVATDSAFLNHLFYVDGERAKGERPLPPGLEFDLLFGVRDRTISLPSAARWDAVREAHERWPLVTDHTGILRSARASALLGEILRRHFEGAR